MKKGISLTAFTERGTVLAGKLAAALDGTVRAKEMPLDRWTAENFPNREALIFVGAAGIAVRATAPYIRSKAEDPAVLCVEETGRWVIPLLSGHLGGANALAQKVAGLTGGQAVITTATDVNGIFAVDLWAKRQGMAVLQPERIKKISSRVLSGEKITIDFPGIIRGEAPPLVSQDRPGDILVDYRMRQSDALQLVPRVLTLGIGCRRGISAETLEAVFDRFCRERSILPQAVRNAASIAVKKDEAGLLNFCADHDWPIHFYDAQTLAALKGAFTASVFVQETVGVDNVCERAAVLASGGLLIESKYAHDGVSFALAECAAEYDWST